MPRATQNHGQECSRHFCLYHPPPGNSSYVHQQGDGQIVVYVYNRTFHSNKDTWKKHAHKKKEHTPATSRGMNVSHTRHGECKRPKLAECTLWDSVHGKWDNTTARSGIHTHGGYLAVGESLGGVTGRAARILFLDLVLSTGCVIVYWTLAFLCVYIIKRVLSLLNIYITLKTEWLPKKKNNIVKYGSFTSFFLFFFSLRIFSILKISIFENFNL